MKKLTSVVLIFYCAMLVLQCAAPCFAETSAIEGKIIGTGPLKVWLNIGSTQGVEADMIFEVRKGEELIAKVLVKKVGTSSSEAVITQLKEGATCQNGDAVKFLSKAAPEEKKEEVKKEEPEKEEVKTEKPPETAIAVTPTPATETKTEEVKAPETKKPARRKSRWFKISGTQFLYIAIIGVAALAISGGGKKDSGGGTTDSTDQTSQNPPSAEF